MAYTRLASITWGSGPVIPMTISYDRKRSGADMQYKIKIVVDPITGTHYFGYPIYLGIKLDNVAKVSSYTLKEASPSQWSSSLTYESGWLTVGNKTNGLTSLAVNIYSGSGSSRNSTYTYAITVDPAASLISVSDGTLGQSVSISITQYVTGATHELWWRAGSSGWQLIATNVGTSYSWTPSISLAQYNTRAEAVVVELSCETYKDGSHIGSATDSAKMAIPASVKPTVSMILADPDGYKTTYGSYIQNRSRLQASLTASGAQGSTITGYSISVTKGTTHIWAYSGSSVTTPALPEDGTLTVTATVTDSRGRTGTATSTISVTAYKAPAVTKLEAIRCTSTGTAQADGEYCKATFSAAVTPLSNKNTAAYKVCHRVKGTTTWTEITATEAAGNYTPTNVSIIFAADADLAHDIRVVPTDAFGPAPSAIQQLGVGFVLAQVTEDMTGVAIGRRATESSTFDVGLASIFREGFKGTHTNETVGDVLAFALDCSPGFTPFSTWSGSTNLPSGPYDYSCGVVHRRTLNQIDVYVKDYTKGRIAVNTYLLSADDPNRTWGGWHFLEGIVAQGSSNGWTYRKWANGTIEQWGSFSVSFNSWRAWGPLYESDVGLDRKTFAISYSSAPVVTATVYGGSYGGWCEADGAPTATQTPKYYFVRPNNSIEVPNTYTVNIYAIGT